MVVRQARSAPPATPLNAGAGGDHIPYPTLGPPFADGTFPFAFTDAFNGDLTGNFQLHPLSFGSLPDGGTTATTGTGLIQSLDVRGQSPVLATTDAGAAIAWLNGSLFLTVPPNQVNGTVPILIADGGPPVDGGSPFGSPSLRAIPDAGFALSYVDASPALWLLTFDASGQVGAQVKLFNATAQSASSLAYDAARRRYLVAFVDATGRVNLAAVCPPP
jgi:hypothetical protein